MVKDIDTVKNELVELFDIESNIINGSYHYDYRFGISKTHMLNGEVMEKLHNYFSDTTIKDGYLIADSMVFVHTTFELKTGIPEQYK